ncbi:type II toxin-antitoxin system RelE/ParE family toxin [Reyranella sp.]|uniref:type II toxin-antitoxin system RelE/ParE family toxin n=1 Tax=Reyranella sp. TaxID=1929291 RepID=UPI003D1136C5
MPRLVLAPRAIADLTAISATLAEAAGKSVAIDYLARFTSTFDRLVLHPLSGSRRSRLGARVRIAVVRPYVVIYRTSADNVMIMRVLHGHRRITRHMLTEPTE